MTARNTNELDDQVDGLIRFINSVILTFGDVKQFDPNAPVIRAIAIAMLTREAALEERIAKLERRGPMHPTRYR